MSQVNGGDSASALTVHSAAERLEGLLSEPEDTQPETAEPETVPEGEDSPEPEASDDAADQADPADEETPSEEPDEEAEPTPEAPAKHKVVIDGQEHEVTLDEALKGYSRQQDYTRKTQQHAEKVKAFETEQTQEKAAVRADRQAYHDRLSQLDETLTALSQEPDWDKLRSEDPALFAQTHAAWQVHSKRMSDIRTERDRVAQQIAQDGQAEFKTRLQSEHAKLVEAIPSLGDPTEGKKAKADLHAYALTQGFAPAEIGQVADHRALVLLHKAMLYDKAQAASAEAAKQGQKKIDKVKVVAPGPSAKAKPKQSELTRRKQRLSQTGSVQDAALALELMSDD